jgi:hypothetical protein
MAGAETGAKGGPRVSMCLIKSVAAGDVLNEREAGPRALAEEAGNLGPGGRGVEVEDREVIAVQVKDIVGIMRPLEQGDAEGLDFSRDRGAVEGGAAAKAWRTRAVFWTGSSVRQFSRSSAAMAARSG